MNLKNSIYEQLDKKLEIPIIAQLSIDVYNKIDDELYWKLRDQLFWLLHMEIIDGTINTLPNELK
jgi:hypothetical protein